MNLKERLQRMLHIVADAEQSGAMSAIERDIILAELREAYADLKFGQAENEVVEQEVVSEQKVVAENEPAVELPIIPIVPIAPAEENAEESDEPEVEVELLFNEEEDEEEEENEVAAPESIAEPEPVAEQGVAEEENLSTLNSELSTAEDENLSTLNSELSTAEDENLSTLNSELSTAEDEYLSTLNSQLSTPKRSALLSLYDDEPTPVVGEQFREAPSVADTIACPKGVAECTPISSLREAIGVADKFMIIRELFGGDGAAYEATIVALDAQPSFEDCLIYISEHYAWRPNNEGTKTLMALLQRKFN